MKRKKAIKHLRKASKALEKVFSPKSPINPYAKVRLDSFRLEINGLIAMEEERNKQKIDTTSK